MQTAKDALEQTNFSIRILYAKILQQTLLLEETERYYNKELGQNTRLCQELNKTAQALRQALDSIREQLYHLRNNIYKDIDTYSDEEEEQIIQEEGYWEVDGKC